MTSPPESEAAMAEPSEADTIAAKGVLFGVVMGDQEHGELELSFLRQLVPAVATAIAESRASAEGRSQEERNRIDSAARADEIKSICDWLDGYQDSRYSSAATHIRCNYFDPGQPGFALDQPKPPESP